MSILSDDDIRALCAGHQPMIGPLSEGVQGGVISYGLTHAGYDLRLGRQLLVFKGSYGLILDPKRSSDEGYRDMVFDTVKPISGKVNGVQREDYYILPPHSYALGASLEHLRIPRNIKGRCVGKSTLARMGILINTTPLEPGWYGHLTIEISNISPCPAVLYAGEGIAQLEFDTLTLEPSVDYDKKGGKYQGQEAAPVPSRMK